MLGKLIKHEFKGTVRIFVLMYAAMLILAAINAVLLPLGDMTFVQWDNEVGQIFYGAIASLTMFLYVAVLCVVFVVTFVIIVVRFYRMFGNEGYLWFTLPATANQHLIAKMVVAFVWTVASCLVAGISIGLASISTGWVFELHRIPEAWAELVRDGFNPWLWLTLGAVTMLTSWLQSITMYYAAIAIGPNIIKSRLGGSVLAYLALYIIVSILSTILLTVLVVILNNQPTIISDSLDTLSYMNTSAMVDYVLVVFMGGFSALSLVLAAAFYALTQYFMSRKLNLP